MDNVQLNNGKLVTIGSEKDVIDVISENLSHELAIMINDILIKKERGTI